MFLIRDWNQEPGWAGFRGGSEYLKEQYDLTRSLGNILEAFESTNCFLLQHPGQKVAGSGEASTIHIAGMSAVKYLKFGQHCLFYSKFAIKSFKESELRTQISFYSVKSYVKSSVNNYALLCLKRYTAQDRFC